jgi:hypothetical protein
VFFWPCILTNNIVDDRVNMFISLNHVNAWRLQIFDLNYRQSVGPLKWRSPYSVICMDYFSHGDEQYLITCAARRGDKTAEVRASSFVHSSS